MQQVPDHQDSPEASCKVDKFLAFVQVQREGFFNECVFPSQKRLFS